MNILVGPPSESLSFQVHDKGTWCNSFDWTKNSRRKIVDASLGIVFVSPTTIELGIKMKFIVLEARTLTYHIFIIIIFFCNRVRWKLIKEMIETGN